MPGSAGLRLLLPCGDREPHVHGPRCGDGRGWGGWGWVWVTVGRGEWKLLERCQFKNDKNVSWSRSPPPPCCRGTAWTCVCGNLRTSSATWAAGSSPSLSLALGSVRHSSSAYERELLPGGAGGGLEGAGRPGPAGGCWPWGDWAPQAVRRGLWFRPPALPGDAVRGGRSGSGLRCRAAGQEACLCGSVGACGSGTPDAGGWLVRAALAGDGGGWAALTP